MYYDESSICYRLLESQVPRFFDHEWAKEQREAGKLLTKNDYDPVKDFGYERNLGVGWLVFWSIIGIIIAILFTVYTLSKSYWVGGSASIAAILLLVYVVYYLGTKVVPAEERNGHKFFLKLATLFAHFAIEPNEEIGKLTREEFRANIEGSLREKAAAVDRAEGFYKVNAKKAFNDAHAIAFGWGMCVKDHGHYYPKKPV